ncbi:cytochrome C assembly protein [Acinetobacter qingfengensis]|uniref:Cytochrome C assembly protein n=1 Tax=Acinetobacter qingfengensis TaxID=1262585 RepID=A0A1E7R5P6_9GAMM|nr:cytochrome c biogenesis protein CcsA [Acinetobacter qingfengensis]KAA8735225.1 cytochrome C assembly protein [Acinetobacter qingfengensis]OEY94626.1 cytochrome C assembly protein [Acinetobacter qingfengensis]
MNLPLIFTILALVAYVTGFLYLLKQFLNKTTTNPFLVWSSLLTGLILHALVLSIDMLTPWGINYDVFNLISFTSGLMLLLSIIFSMYRPVIILNLIATPIAILGMFMGAAFNSPGHVIIEQGLGIDIHIILSLAAYAVLLMATIHACLIWFQNRELKKKQKYRVWVNLLPSLQTMESLLFDLIMVGFILLTVALGFGFFTIENFFGQHLAHKTVFSVISWLIYGGLLVGHWRYGWRGMKAIRFTLIGFALLALGFIGSKFVLEILLMKS